MGNIEKMAARRVTATTVDWAKFAEKIPAAQKPAFNALKNKTDAHIRKLAALPESLPKIDFANYKAKIAVAGMVDDFQKKYDALKIPYPQDTYTSSIDSEASSLKADYAKFVDESKKRIVGIQQEQQYVVDVNKANEDDMTLWPHDETYGEYKKRLEQM